MHKTPIPLCDFRCFAAEQASNQLHNGNSRVVVPARRVAPNVYMPFYKVLQFVKLIVGGVGHCLPARLAMTAFQAFVDPDCWEHCPSSELTSFNVASTATLGISQVIGKPPATVLPSTGASCDKPSLQATLVLFFL